MEKKRYSLAAVLLLCLCLIFSSCGGQGGNPACAGLYAAIGSRTPFANHAFLEQAGAPYADWAAIALSLCGDTENAGRYLDALRAHVETQIAEQGVLDRRKATEYHRIALAVKALGGDPFAFGQDNAGNAIDLVAGGIWAFPGGAPESQGVNALCYALILMNVTNASAPAHADVTRETLTERLLARQAADGSWGLTQDGGDPDVTAMALRALAKEEDKETKVAVGRGLQYLSAQQNGDGTFSSFTGVSSESVAQVILTLTVLGIDPDTDGRFIKNGISLPEALELFRLPDQSYKHTAEDTQGNLLATAEAYIAGAALCSFRTAGGSIE